MLPLLRFFPDLIESPEDVGVEEFTPDAAVQSFDVRVLGRLARLDEGQGDLAVFAPRIEAAADELRAVVDPQHGRKAAPFFELLEHPDDARWEPLFRAAANVEPQRRVDLIDAPQDSTDAPPSVADDTLARSRSPDV